jgi:hypothetical protein
MFRLLAGILLLLVLGGGAYYYLRSDPLRTALDRRWPPATADQQRQAAINSAASALKVLAVPNIAVGADVATIQAIVFDKVKSKGVTKLALATNRQLLRLTADFDMTLMPEDLPEGSDKRSLVAALAPHVVGEVELFLSAATSLSDAPQRALLIKLLPAINRVRIDKLTVKGRYDVTAAADAIALLLDRYADNLSGALSASPFMNVTLPATLQDGFDPSGPIKVDLKDAPGLKLSLSAHPIKSPFGLGAAAWLIDADRVIAIAQLAPLDKLPAQPGPAQESFESVKTAFRKSLQDGLGISDPPGAVWVAVGKALLAQSLDSAFLQSQPCLNGSGSIPKEEFSQKIPTPDGSSIDCTPHIDCTPTKHCDLEVDKRDCRRPRNCTHNHDTRDCNKCLASAFGHCITHGNDPFCESAKAAQNVIYDADFNACNGLGSIDDAACEAEKGTQNGLYAAAKAKCETDKETDRLACEGRKTAQKAGCETEKGIVVGLHSTGNIGNVDGSATGAGSLKLCFQDVHFGAALDKLSLSVAASGSAALDVHFKFVPLDVGGHILCPFEWTADKNITTSVRPQSIGASVSLARDDASGALTYQARLEELPIQLHFQPSPLSLVLQNVNFDLACPVAAGLINGLTLGLAPFIPEFLKDYTYKLKPVTFSFAPDLPTQSILGRSIKPKLSETALSLVVSGVP